MRTPAAEQKAENLFRSDLSEVTLRTDRMFFWLLIAQWIAAVLVAVVWSPQTWIAEYWSIHEHVLAAALLGGLFAVFPLYLIKTQPGSRLTRHVIAIGQMLQSALLVHVTGGRIETHFHVFGSLALLAFYRDWPVLLTASIVVYVDHLLLGVWFPLAVYGVASSTVWRSVEHGFWVGFEVVFLTMSCRQGIRELRLIARRQIQVQEIATELRNTNAELAEAKAKLELEVHHRTKQLSEANKELESKVNELEEAYSRMKVTQNELVQAEKLAALGRFSTGVAHEVKNPLGIILGGVQYLRARIAGGPVETSEAIEALEKIKTSTLRADSIVRGLAQFGRPSNDRLEAVSLRALVEETLALMTYRCQPRGITIQTDFKETPNIWADKNQITQVLFNLFINAIDAMPASGILWVKTYPKKNLCVIEVADTGIGMTPEVLEKAFEPFFSTKKETKGTGLGLSVSKGIIENHRGTITVESQPGKGTTFYIFLPSDRRKQEAA